MTDNMARTLSRVLAGLLLTAAFVIGTSAQGPPSPPAASEPGGLQTLTGKIRWKKSLGVPEGVPPCSIFWVAALDPEQNSKLVWFDNNLQLGGTKLEPDYYACNYRITLPVGRRLLIVPGMGASDSMFALPKRLDQGYSTKHWRGAAKGDAGNDDPDWRPVPGFSRSREFLPLQREVTLKQRTLLKFDLKWTLCCGTGAPTF